MDYSTLFIGILTLVLIVYLLKPKKRPPGFPPGPPGIPIFGNALQFGSELHKRGIQLAKEYGPIFGIKSGAYWLVMLTNAEDIREALSRPEFSGRFGYNPFLEDNISPATKGVVMSQGQSWQDIRRFSLSRLREFGFGKRSMESLIQEEVAELVEEKLRKNLGQPISTDGLFNASVLNVIWALVAGERYKLNDERLAQFLRFITELFKTSFAGAKIFNFMFPAAVEFRKMLPFHLPDSNKSRLAILEAFFQKTIQDHRNTMQVGNPRDFIDAYLEEGLKRKEAGEVDSKFSCDNDDSWLVFTLMDFFGAGSDTTSTTLTWAVFLLALNPEVQEKLNAEILAVAGHRVVQLEDRVQMPYTEAVMQEVYRISSLTPMGVPHATTENVTFKGFQIPKNTIVFPNLYAVHYSKETWGDPEKFRPDRFLSADGKSCSRHPNVMAFSVGKRQCLGETLARDEFFIFLTNIVRQLKITMPSDEPAHTLEGKRDLVLTPEPHRVILLDRDV